MENNSKLEISHAKDQLKEQIWNNPNVISIGIINDHQIKVGTRVKDDNIPETFLGYDVIQEVIGEIKFQNT